jgi:hypothetical protein
MSDEERLAETLEQLSTLAPGPADAPESPGVALAQFKQRVGTAQPIAAPPNRRMKPMNNRRFVAAGLALVAIMALLLSFPAVRAAAGEFLGLFRVQQFAPISVSPQQMALLERLGEEGIAPGEFVVTQEIGDPETVDSPEAAAAVAGFTPRTLPNRGELIRTYVMQGGAGHLVVDLAGARAIVEAAGADPLLLPDSLDGARVDVVVHDSIGQLYDNGIFLLQSPSPDVNYPPDVNPTLLGEALLQVLGTEPAEAARIAQSIDWTSTLLLPIPQDLATYREVNVNGVSGVLLEPFDAETEAAVVWQQDGMIYMMRAGRLSVDELVAHANTVR